MRLAMLPCMLALLFSASLPSNLLGAFSFTHEIAVAMSRYDTVGYFCVGVAISLLALSVGVPTIDEEEEEQRTTGSFDSVQNDRTTLIPV